MQVSDVAVDLLDLHRPENRRFAPLPRYCSTEISSRVPGLRQAYAASLSPLISAVQRAFDRSLTAAALSPRAACPSSISPPVVAQPALATNVNATIAPPIRIPLPVTARGPHSECRFIRTVPLARSSAVWLRRTAGTTTATTRRRSNPRLEDYRNTPVSSIGVLRQRKPVTCLLQVSNSEMSGINDVFRENAAKQCDLSPIGDGFRTCPLSIRGGEGVRRSARRFGSRHSAR